MINESIDIINVFYLEEVDKQGRPIAERTDSLELYRDLFSKDLRSYA